jgi:outer membrane protein OmpA-like peptidoglycan-associated protein
MALSHLFSADSGEDDGHWISVSDLMAGLMVVFLFIAISYMKDIVTEKERIEKIAVTWNETQKALYVDLEKEFQNDLPKWNALLDRDTLSIRFQEPSVLFDTGKAGLKKDFKIILDDFFPRYLSVLKKFRNDIAEVRIEGHTSSEWVGATDHMDAYFHNMQLSQGRTRSVLHYCLSMSKNKKDQDWTKGTITANGLASSKPILNKDGKEDAILSRRVEFRVRTNAEQRIVDILQANN